MEEILDLYQAAYAPGHELVCADETSKQLLAETREPLPMRAGQPLRIDSEYERQGTANLFLAFAPLRAWRTLQVTAHRTQADWAHFVKELVDVHFPDADVITLIVDNLNIHTYAALYATFAPDEAHRLKSKVQLHYTPKHGSWLNMAEIEFSILSRQVLQQRIADQASLQAQLSAWTNQRNAQRARIDWRFTTADARIKLKHLYPVF